MKKNKPYCNNIITITGTFTVILYIYTTIVVIVKVEIVINHYFLSDSVAVEQYT